MLLGNLAPVSHTTSSPRARHPKRMLHCFTIIPKTFFTAAKLLNIPEFTNPSFPIYDPNDCFQLPDIPDLSYTAMDPVIAISLNAFMPKNS